MPPSVSDSSDPGDPQGPPRRGDAPTSTSEAAATESWSSGNGPRARLDRLLAKARSLPKVPGVYLMKDAAGQVLYVGKAGVLPNRVSSYFVPSADLGFRKQPLLDVVEDFDVIECEGEWEALLVESRLIKDTRPRFNDRLVDDKTYPYLAVTLRDASPGVYITRNPADDRFKGARILGPFVSANGLRRAVQLLQKVFKYRTCELDIVPGDPRNRRFRPCLLHAIGQCSAPCADRISPEAYRADVERFVRFLGSKRSALLRELKAEMDEASQQLRFEVAAALRDQIKAIEKLDEREKRRGEVDFEWQPEVTVFSGDPAGGLRSLQRALGTEHPIRCMEAIDIAHLAGGETVGSKVCFIDGRPFKDGYRRYRIQSVENDDYRAIQEVVDRRYREAAAGEELFPDLVLIDGGKGQLNAAMEVFAGLGARPPIVIGLAKKEELIFLPGEQEAIRLGRENPGLKLCQAIRDEAHRFAQHYHHLLVRKRTMPDAGPAKRRSRRPKGGTSPADPSDSSGRPAEGESPNVPESGA